MAHLQLSETIHTDLPNDLLESNLPAAHLDAQRLAGTSIYLYIIAQKRRK